MRAGEATVCTGIVAALPEELAWLRRRLSSLRRISRSGQRFFSGILAGTPVLLTATGDAEHRAVQGVGRLLELYPVSRLLVVGLAGGLSPGLEPGSLLLAREVWEENRPAFRPDPRWLGRAAQMAGARPARLVTTRRIVARPEERSVWLERLPPDLPAAVDMESVFYARAAEERKIPFLVVRAVSDTAEEGLPEFLDHCRGADDSVRRMAVLAHALSNPRQLPRLLKMRRQVRLCSMRLGRFVERLLARDAEGTGQAIDSQKPMEETSKLLVR